jgi:hypothetical protein
MKKGDDVVDDEDDYAVRTRVSQEQVTATLCTEELLPSTQFICIPLPAYQEDQMGGIHTVKTIPSVVPAGFHISQLGLNTVYKVSDKSGFFYRNIL